MAAVSLPAAVGALLGLAVGMVIGKMHRAAIGLPAWLSFPVWASGMALLVADLLLLAWWRRLRRRLGDDLTRLVIVSLAATGCLCGLTSVLVPS